MSMEPNSMQCSIPEALRFLASAAKAAEAHWMNAAADEIERLQKADYEFQSKVADGITDAFLERRWIPVSERLPDDEAEALIAFDDRSIGVAYAVFHHVEEDGGQKWTDGNGFELKQPTHWMPLPEPPAV